MIRQWICAAAAFVSLGVGVARAQMAAPVRSEVPLREVVLTDGVRRYALTIKVGATEIEAGLDTGSSGLRILPHVLKDGDAEATGRSDSYAYQSGAKLDGHIGRAQVAVGDLVGSTTVQLVDRVGCSDDLPRCPVSKVSPEKYGIQGDGLPGEGFKAILGVNMASAEVPGLFAGIGARRWIVELPRPGEGRPGRIILNPTDAEIQGYINLQIIPLFADRRGGAHDAVPGCIANTATKAKICGAVVLDTGAPGILVMGPDVPRTAWDNETSVALLFGDASGKVLLAESLVLGRRDHASRFTVMQKDGVRMLQIQAGLTPYFAYSILYDPAAGTVGFKPREVRAQDPQPVAMKQGPPG